MFSYHYKHYTHDYGYTVYRKAFLELFFYVLIFLIYHFVETTNYSFMKQHVFILFLQLVINRLEMYAFFSQLRIPC